jgi:hypothetical protein
LAVAIERWAAAHHLAVVQPHHEVKPALSHVPVHLIFITCTLIRLIAIVSSRLTTARHLPGYFDNPADLRMFIMTKFSATVEPQSGDLLSALSNCRKENLRAT